MNSMMLIADFESDQQRQSNDQYSVHMNGGSSAPPWQTSTAQNGKMFTVPTRLQESNAIKIKGNITDGMLDIGLRPDGNNENIVCQLNVVYPEPGQSHDQLVIRNVRNGTNYTISDNVATDYFPDPTFDIEFLLYRGTIKISIAGNFLCNMELQHSMDDIRFISVKGEVTELGFLFKIPDY